MATITSISQSRVAIGLEHTAAPAQWASVIIVNYNGGTDVEQCIRSLVSDPYRNYEIILLDNASTDGSAERVACMFPDVRLIRSAHNLGFGAGNNLAAQHASGEYLAFLNPDTSVALGWLDPLIAALEDDPQAGLATSKILLYDQPECINTCGNDVHYTGLTLCRGAGMPHDALNTLAEVSAISGAAFVMRRSLYEALGGFDGTFFLYMEDTDLSWRARLAGYRSIYVPTSVVYHRYTLRFGPHKTFYQERNRYLMLLKGLRWRTLIVLAPALLLAEGVTWGFVLLREPRRAMNKLRAYGWIARHWRALRQSRRQSQALRRERDRDLLAGCTHRLAFEQTGTGWSVRLAHRVFDPLFYMLKRVALACIRW